MFCAQDLPGNFAGGPNAWLQRLLPDLEEDGILVTTLIIGSGTPAECPLASNLMGKGLSVRFLDCNSGPNILLEQKLRWIVRQLNELRPKVFVPNLSIPAYFAAGFARNAGIPSIGVIHSNDAFHHHLLQTFVFGHDSRRIDTIVAVSEFLDRSIARKKSNEILLRRIPYGVPVPKRQNRNFTEGLRVTFVGRFRQEQKRILDVTKSFCNAAKVLPNARFTLLGNGPEKFNMKNIIESHDAGNSVRIKNPLPPSEVQKFMQSQDVIVLLSEYEGLPIALMEAMATGMVPVCLLEESGVKELVIHRENGLIVGDRENGFISALSRLDRDRDLLQRLSLGARRTIETNYASEFQHAKWSDLLKEVAAKSPNRRVRLPLFTNLPAPHPSFRGEDRRSPTFLEKCKATISEWVLRLRMAIRPRARIRAIWRGMTKSF